MACLVFEGPKALQKDLGANDADDAWLASQLKAFQKDLGANDADDAWLGSLLKAFEKDREAMLMMSGLARFRRLSRKTLQQMMLMIRGLALV